MSMHMPNLDTQRAAMKKLSFLIGEWKGEATLLRGPGQVVDVVQTEHVQLILAGLILMIEGVGQTTDGTPILQAVGLVSFDDASEQYLMRAFNDGRWLETEVRLLDGGQAISWGFTLGEMSTHSVLRINAKQEWTEHADITIGTRPPQTLLDLTLRRI